MNPIEINKLSRLHDGKKVIFCKTDFILEEFKYISSLANDVVFITGNSDYCITDDLVSRAPTNIKKWFCQNRLSSSPLLESIPLGMENTVSCSRQGHGHVWDHALEKPTAIISQKKTTPNRLLYANFNINTNPRHRVPIRDICKNLPHITWSEPNLLYSDLLDDIISHEGVVCPQGNGFGDNHRIYESLYLDRIPITFNVEQYKHIHHLYPIVLIQDIAELADTERLKSRIEEAQNKEAEEYLDSNYWLEKIYDEAKKYSIAG